MNNFLYYGIILSVAAFFIGLNQKKMIEMANSKPIIVQVVYVGKQKVDTLDCQGMGEAIYCNDGSVHYSNGSIAHEAIRLKVVSK